MNGRSKQLQKHARTAPLPTIREAYSPSVSLVQIWLVMLWPFLK